MMKIAVRTLFIFALLVALGAPLHAAGLLDINTASVQELTTLPGIGPSLAEKIVEHRATKPFSSVEDLMDVKGIGPAKYAAIKGMISVGGAEGAQSLNSTQKQEGDALEDVQKKGMNKASGMTEGLVPQKK